MAANYIIIMKCVFLVCLMATMMLAGGVSQNFNIKCDSHASEICESPSLEEIASLVNGQPSLYLMIDIRILELYLNVAVNFSNLSSLTISGEPDNNIMTTIICISRGSLCILD